MKYFISLSFTFAFLQSHFYSFAVSRPADVEIEFKSIDSEKVFESSIKITNNIFITDNFDYESIEDINNDNQVANIPAKIKNNKFYYSFKISEPKYCYFLAKENAIKNVFESALIVYPGDSVEIIGKDGQLYFAGKDASRYSCQYLISKSENSLSSYLDNEVPENYFYRLDSMAKCEMNILDSYKEKISREDLDLIYSNIIVFYQQKKYLYLILHGAARFTDNHATVINLTNYSNSIWNDSVIKYFGKGRLLDRSIRYLNSVENQYLMDSCFFSTNGYNNESCFRYLKSRFSGSSLEYLLYFVFKSNLTHYRYKLDNFARSALEGNLIVNSGIKEYLKNYIEMNSTDVKAYDFNMENIIGQKISLHDFKGSIVLLDFWYVGCGPCAALHPTLDSIKCEFKNYPFQIISICLDYHGGDRKLWREALKSGKYTSPNNINLLAFRKGNGSPEVAEKYHITGCPTIVLIAKDGKIAETVKTLKKRDILQSIKRIM